MTNMDRIRAFEALGSCLTSLAGAPDSINWESVREALSFLAGARMDATIARVMADAAMAHHEAQWRARRGEAPASDDDITTTAGERFSAGESCELAKQVFKRFGRDIGAAHAAWCRMLQNNCTVTQFAKMVEPCMCSCKQWESCELCFRRKGGPAVPDVALLDHRVSADAQIEARLTRDGARELAVRMLVETIDSTGGVVDTGSGLAPVADPEWIDLGEAYAVACAALDRDPKMGERAD